MSTYVQRMAAKAARLAAEKTAATTPTTPRVESLAPETCLTCDGKGTHYDDAAMEYWDCSDCLGLGVRVGVQP